MRYKFILLIVLAIGILSCDQKLQKNLTQNQYPEGTSSANSGPWKLSVTEEFGPTVITMRSFPFSSTVATAKSVPWSSWWYPKIEDQNVSDGSLDSALKKYDLYRRAKRGQNLNSAAEYEASTVQTVFAPWEGLCDAWSLAAVLSQEPKNPVAIKLRQDTIDFSISDLKVLLLKTFEAIPDTELKYYGQKFTGDENGWDFLDVYPDQFHRFLEVQLFQQRQAFIMDHDPGIEVWNVPVYKANYVMNAIPGDPNSIAVRTWVYSAESTTTDQRDFVGTREGVREYNYILHGIRDSSGNLVINSGEWIKGSDGVDSVADHPDFFTVIPDPNQVIRKSYNPEIDPEVVDEILAKSF